MSTLTQEQIMRDINPFKHEWINGESWWYGSTDSYNNAVHGYDCEVCTIENSNNLDCLVYALDRVNGDLEVDSSNTILRFEIELDYPIYEQGNILECIHKEEDSPFEVSKRYLVTNVSEVKREIITLKVYTLNDHIDFQYTSHEISAYFKKAVLS